MTDSTGEVTYSAKYTPWGDTLESSGTGNFTFGYFGGLMDEATGLMYVGEGQYYDPETGRFLTRRSDANGNPYLPFDPTGALFVPLAFASLLYGKKKKKSKLDVLIIITLLSLSAGLGVAACGNGQQPLAGSTIEAVVTPVSSSTALVTPEVNGTQTPTVLVTVAPNTSVTEVLDDICMPEAIPQTSGILDAELDMYGVRFAGEIDQWTAERILAVKDAVKAVADRMHKTVGGTSAVDVFRTVFNGITFSWGYENASGTCLEIKTGGCTTDAHNINFVKLTDTPLKARNNIVHEMGHAFAKNWSESSLSSDETQYYRSRPEEVNPEIVLAWAQTYQGLPEHYISGFPDRDNPTDGNQGNFEGFASPQNVLTWQVAVTDAGSTGEEFADQFLGWTFSKWHNSPEGIMRADFMKKYMPGWIKYRLENC